MGYDVLSIVMNVCRFIIIIIIIIIITQYFSAECELH
jgi:hypothetical protein